MRSLHAALHLEGGERGEEVGRAEREQVVRELQLAQPREPARATRRARLVRGEGRGVSD